MSPVLGGRGRTPNFIRRACAERFVEALPLIDAIIWGGLEVSPGAAAQLGIEAPEGKGAPLLVASVKERLDALGLLARVGIGFRHEAADRGEGERSGVILVPPWDDEVGEYTVQRVADPRALPAGNGTDGE
jgi:hypothetical protein